MQDIVDSLHKRKKIGAYVIICFFFLSLTYNYFFKIDAPSYINEEYRMYIVYGLILYKLIELAILYYLLFHRYLDKLTKYTDEEVLFKKLSKQTKLLFFLIPQGNTIFGIIAYKLSENVLFFILFMLFALVTLSLIKPINLLREDK